MNKGSNSLRHNNHKQGVNGHLRAERKRKLDDIGFIWERKRGRKKKWEVEQEKTEREEMEKRVRLEMDGGHHPRENRVALETAAAKEGEQYQQQAEMMMEREGAPVATNHCTIVPILNFF